VQGECKPNLFEFAEPQPITDCPDFVFDKNYKLLSLKEVEQFINTNQHLPNVPSAAEVEANGVNLGHYKQWHYKKSPAEMKK